MIDGCLVRVRRLLHKEIRHERGTAGEALQESWAVGAEGSPGREPSQLASLCALEQKEGAAVVGLADAL
ncbi:MAG TPA: hypothetical protein VKU40_03610, partial [Thermoanaerobaculia bacterium]|nr:hypothetical protein [Thermoanaerobaculia bacterium]